MNNTMQPCQLETHRRKTPYSIEDVMTVAGYQGNANSLVSHYYQIVRGERVPPLRRIYIWAQLFGVSAEALFLPPYYIGIVQPRMHGRINAGLRSSR